MGKASSSKKVARAARAGGKAPSGKPRGGLMFPGALALVVVLGLSLVVYARADRRSQDLGGVPQLGDHIHLSFAVNVCGDFSPDLPGFESRVGIHTHSDGVIHVHPFSQRGVGANSTLGRYFDDARDEGALDISLSDTGFTWLGQEVSEGSTECEGVADPQLRVAFWDEVTVEDSAPRITTGGFRNLRLDTNGAGLTLFYGDPDAEIPKPPSAPFLFQLGAIDGGQVPELAEDGSVIVDDDGQPVLPENLGAIPGEEDESVAIIEGSEPSGDGEDGDGDAPATDDDAGDSGDGTDEEPPDTDGP